MKSSSVYGHTHGQTHGQTHGRTIAYFFYENTLKTKAKNFEFGLFKTNIKVWHIMKNFDIIVSE
jgi:hypothetical protein